MSGRIADKLQATMKCVRVLDGGGFEVVTEAAMSGSLGAGEAVVEVARSGICGSDLKVLQTPPAVAAEPGIVLGHEFVGIVAEVGSEVSNVRPGDRVVIVPNLGCGTCESCLRGRPMGCADPINLGFSHDGGLADLARVPARALVTLPDELDWSVACLAEPLSCVLDALKGVQIAPGSSGAVVGAGPMGLLMVAVLALRGVRPLLVFEPSPSRAELARRCGATATADGSDISSDAWRQVVGSGNGPDVVVDAVGHLLPECMDLAGLRGTVVQLGYNPAAEVAVEPRLINEKGLRIVGNDGSEFTFPDALRLLERVDAPFDEIVTAELGIDDFGEAVERLRDGTEAKILISFR